MVKFEPRFKKINTGDLRTPVSFYEYAPNYGPEPGESEKRVLFDAFARVDKVWLRDLERAKQNGTLEDITVTIRDPRPDYVPTTKHYIGVNDISYYGTRYGIKSVQPDMKNIGFMVIVAGVVS